jgi:hypothetical protein
MQNSFSLGLLHGALYGITPITPWFIGLKRYVFEGQAKGLLTFGGLFLGQVCLLLIAFFGGTELLWLWYYLEPVLIICGTLAMINALVFTWAPQELPVALATRKEGIMYFTTGMFFAVCNPGGIMFGDLLLTTLPENTFLYLIGFIFIYGIVAASLVYIVCLSPLGQKCFGAWSIARMRNREEPSVTLYGLRTRNVQIVSVLAFLTLTVQFLHSIPTSFTTYYADTMFGATPAKKLVPKRDFVWVESTEQPDESSEDVDEDQDEVKVWKLQSHPSTNKFSTEFFGQDRNPPLVEKGPWHTVHKYNALNTKLERDEIKDELKLLELENYDEGGLNPYIAKWWHKTKLRSTFKPDWGEYNEMNSRWLKELTRVRFEMDDILRMQYAPTSNEPRPHLPFNLEYESDYNLDPKDVAQSREVLEDDAIALESLKRNTKVTDSGFFNQTYEMVHRGGQQRMDFSIVRLQDLPQEVNFPWDFPVVHAPNVSQVEPSIEDSDEQVIAQRNEVQNKNVWFLDPIALNTRFLANDPLPETDERWTDLPADIAELRVPNAARRFWLGSDFVTEADMEMPKQTARETIMSKVFPGGHKRS